MTRADVTQDASGFLYCLSEQALETKLARWHLSQLGETRGRHQMESTKAVSALYATGQGPWICSQKYIETKPVTFFFFFFLKD